MFTLNEKETHYLLNADQEQLDYNVYCWLNNLMHYNKQDKNDVYKDIVYLLTSEELKIKPNLMANHQCIFNMICLLGNKKAIQFILTSPLIYPKPILNYCKKKNPQNKTKNKIWRNSRFEDGFALSHFIHKGDIAFTQYLLESSELHEHASLEFNHHFALFEAIEGGHEQMIDFILTRKGYQPNFKIKHPDKLHASLIKIAALTNDIEIFDKILSYAPSKDILKQEHDLMINLALNNRLDILKHLCQYEEIKEIIKQDFTLSGMNYLGLMGKFDPNGYDNENEINQIFDIITEMPEIKPHLFNHQNLHEIFENAAKNNFSYIVQSLLTRYHYLPSKQMLEKIENEMENSIKTMIDKQILAHTLNKNLEMKEEEPLSKI